MVYLLDKKEQLRLEPAHLFTPFPAFHQQLLVILPLPPAPGCEPGFRSCRLEAPVMEPADIAVVVSGTLERTQAPDVTIHIFSHNTYKRSRFLLSVQLFSQAG